MSRRCPLRGGRPCIDDVCSSYGDDECPWPPHEDVSGESVTEIKQRHADIAALSHGLVFPDGYSVKWRQYGRFGGKWRGVGPNGWVECKNRERVETEVWWMVAADENDREHALHSDGPSDG